MKKLNFAILSAGKIAGIMADTVSKMKNELTPYAVASRDIKRADELKERFGFKIAYGSYDELVNDKNVDIVYVASPHSHHYENVKLCLEHGKHVLCEKAFTANLKQAKEIIALSKKKNLFLGEAVWTRFMPWVPKLRGILAEGAIGEISSVQCGFGQPLLHVERMVNPNLAGGALLDLGIYPLTFASLILGGDVEKLDGEAVLTDRGVDAKNSITLKYKSGKMAYLASDMTAWMPNTGVICGSKGYISAHDFWKCQKFTVYIRDSKPYEVLCPFEISGYEYEVQKAIKAINEKKLYCDEMPHSETLRLMGIMDSLRDMWGVRYPFE